MIDEEERKFIFKKIKRISKEYDSFERFKIRVKNYYIKKGNNFEVWGVLDWKSFIIASLWYSIVDSMGVGGGRFIASIAVLEFYKILDENFPFLKNLIREGLNSEFSFIDTILFSDIQLKNDEININKLRELYSYFAPKYDVEYITRHL